MKKILTQAAAVGDATARVPPAKTIPHGQAMHSYSQFLKRAPSDEVRASDKKNRKN
jgi:hypothetical protein